MNSQQFRQPIVTANHANQRRRQWIGLGLSGIVTALALTVYGASVSAPQAPAQTTVIQPAAIDPAVQSVSDYLRAHANVNQAAAIDPAVQSVSDYLRAHANVSQAAAIDPAVAGVAGYLQAHANVSQVVAIDPAVAGVAGYLQAHDLPTR